MAGKLIVVGACALAAWGCASFHPQDPRMAAWLALAAFLAACFW
jgi:hypothetical protein